MEATCDKIFKAIQQLPNINASDLDILLSASQDKNIGLTKAIVQQGFISEENFLMLLVKELRLPSIDLSKYRLDKRLKNAIPQKFSYQFGIIPISSSQDTLTVAVCDPFNVFVIDDLSKLTGKSIDIVLATHTQIIHKLDQFYSLDDQNISRIIQETPSILSIVDQKVKSVDDSLAEQVVIIRMVNLIIKEAICKRALEIHLEPFEGGIRVRYRIDGVLQDIITISTDHQDAITSRIKLMASLNYSSLEVPQESSFKISFLSQEVNLRASFLPTAFGQKIMIRILEKKYDALDLNQLDFSKSSIDLLKEAISKPSGVILVAGPAGSGKSTTLYSLINAINTPNRSIATIEDPIEYLIDGLAQTEVKQEIGFNFAVGLNSILRQSPDIVMVSELRDRETADIAFKASLNNQLVLSTLYANNSVSVLTQLMNMGLEPFLVASVLSLVCVQSFCRRVCPYCKVSMEFNTIDSDKIRQKIKPGTVLCEGKGCEQCHYTGYLGRIMISEVLKMDDDLRSFLLRKESSYEILRYLQEKQGMKLLFDDCLDKMIQGQTTLSELYRFSLLEENKLGVMYGKAFDW